MTLFDEDLFGYLSTSGTAAGDRIYPMSLPQDVILPAIVYFRVSPGLEYTHSGLSKHREPRYQLDCYDETYLKACQLAEELIDRIGGYRGQMGNRSVEASFIEGGPNDWEPETGRHRASLDVVLHYQ